MLGAGTSKELLVQPAAGSFAAISTMLSLVQCVLGTGGHSGMGVWLLASTETVEDVPVSAVLSGLTKVSNAETQQHLCTVADMTTSSALEHMTLQKIVYGNGAEPELAICAGEVSATQLCRCT